MASGTTPNIGLYVYDSADGATTPVRDWFNNMNGHIASNMTILDNEVGNLKKFGSSFKTEITGDDVKTSFVISHNRNTSSPAVFIYDENGKQLFPEIIIINNAQLSLNYIYPLADGTTHKININ